MKKIILSFVALILLSLLLTSFLPWWSFCIAAIAIPLVFELTPLQSLFVCLAGFLGIYGGMAFWIDHANGSLLTTRIGELFGLKAWNLVILSAVIPALIGGLFGFGTASILAKKYDPKFLGGSIN